ncbi:F-box/LRR-repeat protein 7-like [Exaiptasia diaphana]|uniref:F-box domain-containing protein n=1 Tax=Exaiptasia diaphana TaxID=2652724 RepID=A0A913YC65_EXADI|nr:F-box/LRR-repeat protein 7-like [Exaiptasia diaphana]
MGNSQGRPSSVPPVSTKSPRSGKYPESKHNISKNGLDHHPNKRNAHHSKVEFDIPDFLQEKQEVRKSPVFQRHLRDPDPVIVQEGTSVNRGLLIPKSELQVPDFLSQTQYHGKLLNVTSKQEVIEKRQSYPSIEDMTDKSNSQRYVKPRQHSKQHNTTTIEQTKSSHSKSMSSLHNTEVGLTQTKSNDFIDDFGAFSLKRKSKTVVDNDKNNDNHSKGRLAPGVTSARKYVVNQPMTSRNASRDMHDNSHMSGMDDDSLQSMSSISNKDSRNNFVAQKLPHSFHSQDDIQVPQGYESPDSALGYIADSSVNNPDSSIESGRKITRQNSLQAHLRQRLQDYERFKEIHSNSGVHARYDSDSTTISDQSIFGKGMSSVTPLSHPNFVHINSLQDGILLKILSYLNTLELCKTSGVCRRWQSLAWDPILWNKIEIVNYKESNINRVLRNLLGTLAEGTQGYCLTVHHIRLNGCELLSDKALGSIARYCIDLEKLEVDGCCCITSRGLQDLLLNCHSLSHLNLSGCTCVNSLSMPNANGFSLENNATYLKLLQLDLSDCVAFDDFGLRTLGLTCRMLETLYLRRCSRITDVGIKHIASHCHHLKELSTSDCFKIRDFSLKEIAKNTPGLRYLSVAKCPVSDTGIKYIGRHCVRLKYLNIRGCDAVTDIGIAYVVQNCLKLRSIDIGKCNITDNVLHTIGIHCPQLKKLSIRGCIKLTDEGIRSIATQCCNLQYFNVQECNLSYDTFTYIREHCRNCIIEHTCPAFF